MFRALGIIPAALRIDPSTSWRPCARQDEKGSSQQAVGIARLRRRSILWFAVDLDLIQVKIIGRRQTEPYETKRLSVLHSDGQRFAIVAELFTTRSIEQHHPVDIV